MCPPGKAFGGPGLHRHGWRDGARIRGSSPAKLRDLIGSSHPLEYNVDFGPGGWLIGWFCRPVRIQDPLKFTHDWQFTCRYVRDDSNEWPDDPELCGGPQDRNPIFNGRVTVQLPQSRQR